MVARNPRATIAGRLRKADLDRPVPDSTHRRDRRSRRLRRCRRARRHAAQRHRDDRDTTQRLPATGPRPRTQLRHHHHPPPCHPTRLANRRACRARSRRRRTSLKPKLLRARTATAETRQNEQWPRCLRPRLRTKRHERDSEVGGTRQTTSRRCRKPGRTVCARRSARCHFHDPPVVREYATGTGCTACVVAAHDDRTNATIARREVAQFGSGRGLSLDRLA